MKFKLDSNFYHHYLEFKLRFKYSIFSFILSFFICYYYYPCIIYFYAKPFLKYEHNFIFIDITEAFYTSIQISFFSSLYLILPLIIYQFWCFFIPSEFTKKRKKYNFLIFFVFLTSLSSIVVVYLMILPKLYEFLLDFKISTNLLNIQLQAGIKSYIQLNCKIFFFTTFFSLLPFFLFLLVKMKITKIKNLAENRFKIFLCIVFTLSLILPPDMFLQITLSVILQCITEFLILFGFLYEKIIVLDLE